MRNSSTSHLAHGRATYKYNLYMEDGTSSAEFIACEENHKRTSGDLDTSRARYTRCWEDAMIGMDGDGASACALRLKFHGGEYAGRFKQ